MLKMIELCGEKVSLSYEIPFVIISWWFRVYKKDTVIHSFIIRGFEMWLL